MVKSTASIAEEEDACHDFDDVRAMINSVKNQNKQLSL